MITENRIPDILMPVVNRLDNIERSLSEKLSNAPERKWDITSSITNSLTGSNFEDLINIIPETYGRPGTCHEVLLVVVLASKASATGKISETGVGTTDFAKLISKTKNHINECPKTAGIVFWSISSWHPFVWQKHRWEFSRVPVTLKIFGSGAVMI